MCFTMRARQAGVCVLLELGVLPSRKNQHRIHPSLGDLDGHRFLNNRRGGVNGGIRDMGLEYARGGPCLFFHVVVPR